MSGELDGKKFHLVGIGGAGMSGLALAAHQLGAQVSGSDREESSYLQRLREAGITVTIGHEASNIPAGAVVVRSTAIRDDNPEIAAAINAGLDVQHRSELLAQLAELRPVCITVAGTHGKTTTTAMIAHALAKLGANPSFFVGGEVKIGELTTNAHMGDGEIVVVEADESDGSFRRYRPTIAVVTNIEYEHPETWQSLDQLLVAFAEHVAPAEHVVVDVDQPRIDELGLASRERTFSVINSAADFSATAIETSSDPAQGTSFALGDLEVQLGVRGTHNVSNALAALAALELAGYPPAVAAPTLADFTGVARRFQYAGRSPQGAHVYDDYAHHPTEVRAALETARQTASGGRVVAVYQPHLFSRSIAYRREFAEALVFADVVIVIDIYPSRERAEDFPGVSGWLVATAVADVSRGNPVYYAPSFDDAIAMAGRCLEEGDLCIAMGAGSIMEFSRRLVGESG